MGRYRGSEAFWMPLAPDLVEKNAPGDSEIEGVGPALHRDADDDVAGLSRTRREPATFSSEDDDDGTRVADITIVPLCLAGRSDDDRSVLARPPCELGRARTSDLTREECTHRRAHDVRLERI